MEKHHAYLVYGDSLAEAAIPEAYKEQSIDVLHLIRERFSIDDARELSSLSLQTPFEADTRTFVLVISDIEAAAQNALLKLLEEPPQHAQFFIVVPATLSLLPTLRSRLHAERPSQEEGPALEEFMEFSKAAFADRMALVAQKTKEKDKQWISRILLGCEHFYSKDAVKNEQLLKALVFVRQYIDTKGASAKMLLEDIALRMPVQ